MALKSSVIFFHLVPEPGVEQGKPGTAGDPGIPLPSVEGQWLGCSSNQIAADCCSMARIPSHLEKNSSADSRQKVRQGYSWEPTSQSHSAQSSMQVTPTEELQAPTPRTIMGQIAKLFHYEMMSQILNIRSAEDMNATCFCEVSFPTHIDVKPTQLARLMVIQSICWISCLTWTHHSGSGQHFHVVNDRTFFFF